MAQQSKLSGRNGMKKICVVCVQTCWCQSSQVFGRVCLFIRHECTECQACEGSLAWMLYWNNAYLYAVHADIFNHEGSAQSTVLQVALLAKQAFSRTFFVAKIGEQLAWHTLRPSKEPSGVSGPDLNVASPVVPFKPFVRPGLLCRAVVAAHVLPAGNQHAGAVGVCSSSAQCKDDEASDKTDLRHEHADRHP